MGSQSPHQPRNRSLRVLKSSKRSLISLDTLRMRAAFCSPPRPSLPSPASLSNERRHTRIQSPFPIACYYLLCCAPEGWRHTDVAKPGYRGTRACATGSRGTIAVSLLSLSLGLAARLQTRPVSLFPGAGPRPGLLHSTMPRPWTH